MGPSYLEPPQFNLQESYDDSNCCSPLVFILSAGSDPMAGLVRFAADKGIEKTSLMTISLGQGQVRPIMKHLGENTHVYDDSLGTHCRQHDQHGPGDGPVGGAAELPPGRELDEGVGQDLQRGHRAGGDPPQFPPVAHQLPQQSLPRGHLTKRYFIQE